VVESLFNAFFRKLKQETLCMVSRKAKSDLDTDGCRSFTQQLTQKTEIDLNKITWSHTYLSNALGRLGRTNGNSIVEKFFLDALVNLKQIPDDNDIYIRHRLFLPAIYCKGQDYCNVRIYSNNPFTIENKD